MVCTNSVAGLSHLKHGQSKRLVQIAIRFYHCLTVTTLKIHPGDGFCSLVRPVEQLPGQIWTTIQSSTVTEMRGHFLNFNTSKVRSQQFQISLY